MPQGPPASPRAARPAEHRCRVCVPLPGPGRVQFLGKDRTVRLLLSPPGFRLARSCRAQARGVRDTVALGADEIDMVIDRGAFLSGDDAKVFNEIVAVKEACGSARLKVILETGELGTLDNVAAASRLAMHAGADFIKTSTGQIKPAATFPVVLVMLEAIREHYLETGVQVGMKPAGGIRTAKDALRHLVMLAETLGSDWMTNEWYRFADCSPPICFASSCAVPTACTTSPALRGRPGRARHRDPLCSTWPAPWSCTPAPSAARSPSPSTFPTSSTVPSRLVGTKTSSRPPTRRPERCCDVPTASADEVDRAIERPAQPTRPSGATFLEPSGACTCTESPGASGRSPRAGGAGVRQRQAHPRDPGRRHPARRTALLLLRGLGGQAALRGARRVLAPSAWQAR